MRRDFVLGIGCKHSDAFWTSLRYDLYYPWFLSEFRDLFHRGMVDCSMSTSVERFRTNRLELEGIIVFYPTQSGVITVLRVIP